MDNPGWLELYGVDKETVKFMLENKSVIVRSLKMTRGDLGISILQRDLETINKLVEKLEPERK